MSNKSIAKNSIYNMIYRGFSVIFPVITMAYISRVLLADGVGKVEYARTIVTYFATAAALGIPNYGIKTIAQTGEDKHSRSKAFWEMFYINAVSTVVCIFLYYVFVSTFHYFSDRRILFYVMGSLLVLNFINIDWYYQGTEEYRYITVRSIAIKILSFVLMLLFVKSRDDYLIYAAILCLATAGNNFFNIYHLKKQISFVPIRQCDISIHLKPIFMLLGATLATEVYTMLDTIILEYLKGEEYVGYYQNCIKIVRLVYTMSIAMVATFYPRISYYIKNNMITDSNLLLSKGVKVLMMVAAPCSIGILLTSEYIVPVLLGDSFLPSIGCLRIVSVLIIIFSFAYLLGHIILMASGNEKRILLATICGAVINATLNFILIPQFEHYGAAAASVVAETVVTVILIIKAKNYFKLDIDYKYIITLIVSLLAMIIAVLLLKMFDFGNIINLIISIALAAVVYVASLILFKNDTAVELLNSIKTKLNHGD